MMATMNVPPIVAAMEPAASLEIRSIVVVVGALRAKLCKLRWRKAPNPRATL